MAKVVITRPPEWINRRRKYKLVLDDTPLGELKRDEILEFDLPAGRHQLKATIDWCSSNTFELDLGANETRYLRLSGFRHSNWLMPLSLGTFVLYLIVFRFLYHDQVWLSDIVLWIIAGSFGAVMLYFLTLGRQKYLWLRNDVR